MPLITEVDYLSRHVSTSLGLFEGLDGLQPQLHALAEGELAWLHLDDGLPRHRGSARDALPNGS